MVSYAYSIKATEGFPMETEMIANQTCPGRPKGYLEADHMALSSAVPSRTLIPQQSHIQIAVQYRDGLALTFLFERSDRVSDIMAAVSRAGQVLKVVL